MRCRHSGLVPRLQHLHGRDPLLVTMLIDTGQRQRPPYGEMRTAQPLFLRGRTIWHVLATATVSSRRVPGLKHHSRGAERGR